MWESRVLQRAFERLELHEGKLSRAVLRGGGGGDVTSLPDPGWATTPVYPAVAGRKSAPRGPTWSRPAAEREARLIDEDNGRMLPPGFFSCARQLVRRFRDQAALRTGSGNARSGRAPSRRQASSSPFRRAASSAAKASTPCGDQLIPWCLQRADTAQSLYFSTRVLAIITPPVAVAGSWECTLAASLGTR